MPDIHSVLVTAQLSPENRLRLEQALDGTETIFCAPQDAQTIEACIHRVDAAILNGDADDQILSGENLKWIIAAMPDWIRPCARIFSSGGLS